MSVRARTIIEQLLQLNPAVRSGGSIDNLKAHSWFSGFDWVPLIQDGLISKQMAAPYIPEKVDYSQEVAEAIA